MDSFKQWLISENIQINPSIQGFPLSTDSSHKTVDYADRNKLTQFIKDTFKKMFNGDEKNLYSRYDIYLKEIRSGYSEVIFEFEFLPKKYSSEEEVDPNHDLYDFYMKHRNGKTGKYLFSSMKDAIKEIPNNPNYVYRGMSYEEWQFIKKNGFIQSKGNYNLGDVQNNLTFYGNAQSATYYASDFAPVAYKTSIKKPSIVIAIPRNLVKSHEDDPKGIPQSEYAHYGKLDSSNIKEVWMLVPEKAEKGIFSIVFEYKSIKDAAGKYSSVFYLTNPREGSRKNPSIRYSLLKLKN